MHALAAQPGRLHRAARGITLLEVVFATIILAMTVATLASAVNAISGQQTRSRHLLACAEMANRLIIQYLDDDASMPSEHQTVSYGDSEYRWRKSVTTVASTLNPEIERAVEESQARQGAQSPNRLKKIAVTVWLSERSGGAMLPDSGAPQTTLVRVVDPWAFARRPPDSITNQIERGTLLNRVLGDDTQGEE
jgi:type II secretory pathway pseudopilin PulG